MASMTQIEFTAVDDVRGWDLDAWLDKYGEDGVTTMLTRYMESKARMKQNQDKRKLEQKALKATLERVAKERGLTVDQLMNERVDMATGEKVTGNEKPAAGEQ